MICPHELARDLSALHGKGCKVVPEVRNAGRPVPGSRNGANDESAGNRDAGNVETDHMVASGGDFGCERSDDEADETGMEGSRL